MAERYHFKITKDFWVIFGKEGVAESDKILWLEVTGLIAMDQVLPVNIAYIEKDCYAADHHLFTRVAWISISVLLYRASAVSP